MSYYDVDAILTDAEKTPCKFEIEIPDLGHLDNNPAQPLKAGTRLALPLWLAEMLAISSTGGDSGGPPVTLDPPAALSTEVTQALKADPRAVPLRDQSSHFYSLGTRMLDLFEDRELGAVLRNTFVTRATDVALHARKAGEDGGVGHVSAAGEEFLRGLDEWERALFRKAHEGTRTAREWAENVKKG